MSLFPYLHNGPYVVCKTKIIPSVQNIYTCSNFECESYNNRIFDKKNKFCQYCGSTCTERQINIEVSNIDSYEIAVDLLKEALFTPTGDSFFCWMLKNNTHIWISNKNIPNARKWSFYPHEDIQYIPITPDLIDFEKEQFCNFHEKELEILYKEYGKENVEIQWGIINDIS
jgi:hypothetical protein